MEFDSNTFKSFVNPSHVKNATRKWVKSMGGFVLIVNKTMKVQGSYQSRYLCLAGVIPNDMKEVVKVSVITKAEKVRTITVKRSTLHPNTEFSAQIQLAVTEEQTLYALYVIDLEKLLREIWNEEFESITQVTLYKGLKVKKFLAANEYASINTVLTGFPTAIIQQV